VTARVAWLDVNPIRGFGLLRRDEVVLDRAGVAGNRRFFLVDADGRRCTLSRAGGLVRFTASWDEDSGRLAVTFPDGAVVQGEIALGARVTTEFALGRQVQGRFVEGPWSDAISACLGRPLRLVRIAEPGGAFPSGRPVSLVSAASLAELARQAGVDAVDERRFRMLVGLDGCEPHAEDGWIGGRVRVGEALLEVGGPVDRCAATTRNPESGEVDLDTLRTIKGYRGLRDGKHADFGVFAAVLEPGRVRVGDLVEPL
jgi:uncharacterized protein YcbX